ncbi:hypothetical protein K470DRAFT_258274 [Piedraia hortae CBS 480.64]|uniref:AGC-kinase C-terminal domain-containing protein n=1 Tax=Piedraia hortae CBS 480.64 TaxID=1314780 RepID=A0A6A7BY16_9PEZI|nr:hypothetical protein K470DRAFT_258274 [Piedraia hortae CBS 480.64]
MVSSQPSLGDPCQTSWLDVDSSRGSNSRAPSPKSPHVFLQPTATDGHAHFSGSEKPLWTASVESASVMRHPTAQTAPETPTFSVYALPDGSSSYTFAAQPMPHALHSPRIVTPTSGSKPSPRGSKEMQANASLGSRSAPRTPEPIGLGIRNASFSSQISNTSSSLSQTIGTPYSSTSSSFPLPQHGGKRPLTTGFTAKVGQHTVPTHHSSSRPAKAENRRSRLPNPISFLSRRKSGQDGAPSTAAQAYSEQTSTPDSGKCDFDPRIKGNVVHDFSTPLKSDAGPLNSSGGSSIDMLSKQVLPEARSANPRKSIHSPIFREMLDEEPEQSKRINAEQLENRDFLRRASNIPPGQSALPPFARRSQHLDTHLASLGSRQSNPPKASESGSTVEGSSHERDLSPVSPATWSEQCLGSRPLSDVSPLTSTASTPAPEQQKETASSPSKSPVPSVQSVQIASEEYDITPHLMQAETFDVSDSRRSMAKLVDQHGETASASDGAILEPRPSNVARFSFQLGESAAQEQALEEKHREIECEKLAKPSPEEDNKGGDVEALDGSDDGSVYRPETQEITYAEHPDFRTMSALAGYWQTPSQMTLIESQMPPRGHVSKPSDGSESPSGPQSPEFAVEARARSCFYMLPQAAGHQIRSHHRQDCSLSFCRQLSDTESSVESHRGHLSQSTIAGSTASEARTVSTAWGHSGPTDVSDVDSRPGSELTCTGGANHTPLSAHSRWNVSMASATRSMSNGDLYFDDGCFEHDIGNPYFDEQTGKFNEEAFDDDTFLNPTNRLQSKSPIDRLRSKSPRERLQSKSPIPSSAGGPYPSFARGANHAQASQRDTQMLLEDLPLFVPTDPKAIPQRNPSEDAKRLGLTGLVPPLPVYSADPEAMTKMQTSLNAYHAALAKSANRAAAEGRFIRQPSISSEPANPQPSPDDRSLYSQDDAAQSPSKMEFDFGFDDPPVDEDDDMVAAANADVLSSEDAAFYGQEFGFYARARPYSEAGEPVNGGYFGKEGDDGLTRRKSIKEPNLTPITERSEFSRRSSAVNFSSSCSAMTPGTPGGVTPFEQFRRMRAAQAEREEGWGSPRSKPRTLVSHLGPGSSPLSISRSPNGSPLPQIRAKKAI